LAKSDKVFGDHSENHIALLSRLQLEHILHKVVAKRVFNQLLQVSDYDICQYQLLSFAALLKASLHHTAPVLMSAYLLAIDHASFKDELGVRDA
jgi:hypothetical protein